MDTSKSAGKKAGRRAADSVAVIDLAAIVAAGASGIYTSPEVHAPLVEQGLVEINPGMVDESGNIATRATQKGIESLGTGNGNSENANTEATSETAVSGKTEKVKTMFQIEDNVPVPAISGRGRGGETYPFEQLAVGQSFFVANSESKPNAAKSLASTVSSATARYAVPDAEGKTKTNKKGETVPVMVETRKFIVRSVEGGARVWRTQ